MACEVCSKKSGFYTLCKVCFMLKENGGISKCQDCGIWKEGNLPQCKDCWLKGKKELEKRSPSYKETELEKEEKDFRSKYECKFRADDGHKVRSKAEEMIDNWLYHKGIAHAYERRVPIEEDVFCDFFIPQGNIWIEYWGSEDDKYIKRKKAKIKLYKENNKNLLELEDKDIANLDDVLPKKLAPFFPKGFEF